MELLLHLTSAALQDEAVPHNSGNPNASQGADGMPEGYIV